MKVYPYQEKFILNKSQLIVIKKSKRIGISEAIAARAVRKCLFQNIEQLLVSSSQRQSNYLMGKVEKWIQYCVKRWGIKLETDSKTEKKVKGGKSIFSLPSKPETITGFDGDVSIDEYGFHKEDYEIYKSLTPTLARGRQVIISSTCYGQSNMFYKIYSDTFLYPDFNRNSINIYEAIEQGCELDANIVKRNSDEDTFRESYMCEFIDEQTAYFTYDLLKSITEDYNEATLKGKCFIGVDVGRTQDRTAIAVVCDSKLKSLEVLHKKDFQTQFDTIAYMIKQHEAEKVLIDKGLIGYQLAEDLERDFWMVEGVQFTSNYKNELVTNAKKLMEQKNFRMFENRDLISDFHSIKRNITPSNQVNFDSKRDEKGHADRAWAVMLALLASQERQPSIKMAFSE